MIVTPPTLEQKLHSIVHETASSLPSIPKAVHRVLHLLNQPSSSTDDLAEAIAQDPVLSAKALRLANSAFFGIPRQIDTLDKACLLIGADTIRTLVLASGLMGSFELSSGFDLKRFWNISLLSAHIASDIAPIYGCDKSRAYTAALLHGLGILAIHKKQPELSSRIGQECLNQGVHQTPYSRADLEHAALGYSHAQVSAAIARMWHLPEEVCISIEHYPHPSHSLSHGMASLIHISVALAFDLADNKPEECWSETLDKTLSEWLEPTMLKLPQLRPKFEKAQAMVDMLVAA